MPSSLHLVQLLLPATILMLPAWQPQSSISSAPRPNEVVPTGQALQSL